ncbi:hypothetical protein AMJ83_01825 [candidate division WOR_3 bacterium SM23_42]|uniref:Radical SAM core domain-containing protein n=1 Tax=candidate division WOR_3 bacterium SM23_42 TaxID=1703779 RepID=A0A0S8FXQ8_UNCW3|nr:MAG: hypothetical protein AMJ83_01825 [candidate division WOR_3 bacterium SM23_42]
MACIGDTKRHEFLRDKPIKQNRERKLKILRECIKRYWMYLPNIIFQEFRLVTLIDYRFSKKNLAFYPLSVNLELTARCNLRCKMCWLWGEHGVGYNLANDFARNEMNLNDIRKIVKDLNGFKPVIHLQGGEILLRKDITEIMKYIASLNLIFGFTTNGTLITSQLAKEIVKYATVISFSLDGPEKRHDRLRGKGNFKRAISGLEKLLSQRDKSPLPFIKINVLWQELDHSEIREMVEMASEMDVDALKFGDLQFIEKTRAEMHKKVMKRLFGIDCASIDGYIGNGCFDIDELWNKFLYLRKMMEDRRNLKCDIWNTSSKEILKKWYCGRPSDSYNFCFFPWVSTIIRYNGDVVPCGEYRHPEYVVGNVKRQRFRDIWNSHSMRRFRQVLKKVRFFPGCDRCCGLHSYAR